MPMSRPWADMSHEELLEELDAGNAETDRRMAQLMARRGAPQGKPGRPPKNAAYRFGGADPDSETDDASGAVS